MPNTYQSNPAGSGIAADLCATDSYLFTDGTFSQQGSQVFGVRSVDVFQTTAKLTCAGKIYTICKGRVLIQPQAGNPDKVNLVLSPYSQPCSVLNIRYIVYRGLSFSDFFITGVDQPLIAGSATVGSAFIKQLWTSYLNYYASIEEPAPVFKAAFVGYHEENDTAQVPEDTMDAYFFKNKSLLHQTNPASTIFDFELPLIDGGVELGQVNGEIGIDIVFGRGDNYNPKDDIPSIFNLAFARLVEHQLDLTGKSGQEQKRIKQLSHSFMDLAAFYNLHANGLGKLRVPGATASILKTKEEIAPKISAFATKDIVYLLVRSERGRYYNYYDNYGTGILSNMLLSWGDNVLEPQQYETHGWPILQMSALTDKVNLSFFVNRKHSSRLYVNCGTLSGSTLHEDGFVRGSLLLPELPPETEPDSRETNYTRTLSFDLLSVGTAFLGGWIDILFKGNMLYGNSPGVNDQKYDIEDLDDLFGLLDDRPLLPDPGTGLSYPVISDFNKELVYFPAADQAVDIAVVTNRCVHDAIRGEEGGVVQRRTYETVPYKVNRPAINTGQSRSFQSERSVMGWRAFAPEINNYYALEDPNYFSLTSFTAQSNTINGLKLETRDGNGGGKKIVGLTQVENERLSGLIQEHGISNPRIYFDDAVGEKYVSVEGVSYNYYNLAIVGEVTTGILEVHFPVDAVSVYSLDGNCYFSAAYSQHVEVINLSDFVTLFKI